MQIAKITDCDVCYWVELGDDTAYVACKKRTRSSQPPLTFEEKLILALCAKVLELEKENGSNKTTQS